MRWLTILPTPALPGSGYVGMISARNFKAPHFCGYSKIKYFLIKKGRQFTDSLLNFLTGYYYFSTFRISLNAFSNVSFGRAPIAIWGIPSMGTKSSEGILWIPNIPASSRWSSVSTL